MLAHNLLHERLGLGVAKLGLGLSLELRLGKLDRDDRRQPFSDVLAREVVVLVLEQSALAGVVVDDPGQRRPEALFVSTAFVRVDRVSERIHALRKLRVPLHRYLDADAPLDVFGSELDNGLVDHAVLACIYVPHEVGDATLVAECGLARLTILGELDAFVANGDCEPTVEERHLLKPPGESLEGVDGRLEYLGIGPEGDCRARLDRRRVALERSRRLAVVVRLVPRETIALDLGIETPGQRVDDGDTDTVETSGDDVAATAELATRVQGGQYEFDRRPAFDRV